MLLTRWTWALCFALLGNWPSFSCPRQNEHVAQVAEISFQLYNDHLIVVKGNIGSIENVNIVMDTGTSPTEISTEIFKRLNLRGNTESLDSLNGKIDVQSAIVMRIDIGALHIAPARVVVKDLGFMERSLGITIAAVAGLDILGVRNFIIDFRKNKIFFTSTPALRNSTRFEKQNPYLTVRANIGGEDFRLLVDSGTPGLLLFQKCLYRGTTRLERLANASSGASMFTAIGSMHAERFRARDVRLGTHNIGPQTVLVADRNPDPNFEFDGLLGLGKAEFQRIGFDFENGLLGWE